MVKPRLPPDANAETEGQGSRSSEGDNEAEAEVEDGEDESLPALTPHGEEDDEDESGDDPDDGQLPALLARRNDSDSEGESDDKGEDEDDHEAAGASRDTTNPRAGERHESTEEEEEEDVPEDAGPAAIQASGVQPDEGADLPDYTPTEADRRLDAVLGDHIHDNDGSHLDGGIPDDALWQARHRLLTAFPSRQYATPSCRVGKNIIAQFRHELEGSRLRKWNSERPFVFLLVVLQVSDNAVGSKAIKARLKDRLQWWRDGGAYHAELVDDTVLEMRNRRGGKGVSAGVEREAKAFDSHVKHGKIRSAVRTATSRAGGGHPHA